MGFHRSRASEPVWLHLQCLAVHSIMWVLVELCAVSSPGSCLLPASVHSSHLEGTWAWSSPVTHLAVAPPPATASGSPAFLEGTSGSYCLESRRRFRRGGELCLVRASAWRCCLLLWAAHFYAGHLQPRAERAGEARVCKLPQPSVDAAAVGGSVQGGLHQVWLLMWS